MKNVLAIFCCYALMIGLPAQAETLEAVPAEAPRAWSEVAQEILINALSLSDVPYKFGGKSPEQGFDCSGLVGYVFKQTLNLTLPHNARAISRLGQAVPRNELQPGDLVFFNTLKKAFSHVGIYIGEGRFIHAPATGGKVLVMNMDEAYWAKRFNGARRLSATTMPAD